MIRQTKTAIKELTAQYRAVLKHAFFAGVIAIATAGAASAETPAETDVTFSGKYANNVLNVADDVDPVEFTYKGTNADGTATTDFNASTTGTATNIVKSNFAYTLADGTPTNLDETSTEWAAKDYIAGTVAGTNEGGNDYTKVHVAEGYSLDAATKVDDGFYSYENPQYPDVEGSEQYIVLDKDGSARTLKSTYSLNEAYTSGSMELSSETTAADLISKYSYQKKDEAGTPTSHKYVLSDDGLGVKDLNNDGQIVVFDEKMDADLKTALQGMLSAYAEDSGTNLTNAKAALAGLQDQENANFNAAKAVYAADNTKQGTLETNYGTYTAATTALTTAQGKDNTNSQAYNTANSLLTAARDVYNAPIIDTIDTHANNAIEASLEEGGAINDAIAAEENARSEADINILKLAMAESNARQTEEQRIETESKDRDDALKTRMDEGQKQVAALFTAEINERKAEDETLQANIDAEADARSEADTILQANITAEADARIAEDKTLNDKIEQEVATARAAEKAIRDDFAANDAVMLQSANAYTDKKVDTLEKNVSGGIAAATALSAVEVSNVKCGEMSVGAGYGYYNGQSAAAFGAALGISDSWSVNAGAGIAQGDETQFSIRAGANYKFKLF